MTQLVKYNAARTALAEAHAIDEVKDIRDKAEAMAAYARQAKDVEMIQWVTEIKVRAERKAGEMLAEMEKNPGAKGSGSNQHEVRSHDVTAPKLSDLGISKNESSRWQKLAAVPEDKFEQAVSAAKEIAGEVTTAAMLRAAKPEHTEAPKPKLAPVISDELAGLRAENEALREANADQGRTIKELLEDNESMAKSFEADFKLTSAIAENKKVREMNRILEERVRGLQNECNAAKRAAQSWQRKYENVSKAA